MGAIEDVYLEHATVFVNALTARIEGNLELCDSLIADMNAGIMSLVGLDIAANLIKNYAFNFGIEPMVLWQEIMKQSPVTVAKQIHQQETPNIKV